MQQLPREHETRIVEIDGKAVRGSLESIGATIVFPRTLFTRVIFNNEKLEGQGRWVRLRDEGGIMTLSVKEQNANTINGAGEAPANLTTLEDAANLLRDVLEVEVPEGFDLNESASFETLIPFIEAFGLDKRNYQENFREEWELESDGQTIKFDLDTWPGVPEWIEVEAKTPADVETGLRLLGLENEPRYYGPTDETYREKYHINILPISELTFKNEGSLHPEY